MTVEQIQDRLHNGFLIKFHTGHYYLVQDEKPETDLEEISKKKFASLPVVLCDETKRTKLYCLDISDESKELDHGR